MNTRNNLMEDLSNTLETLLNHTMEDQLAIKSLEVINSYVQKESLSHKDIIELLDKVSCDYQARMNSKNELLTHLVQHCVQLGNTKIAEAISVGIGKLTSHLCNKIDTIGQLTNLKQPNTTKQPESVKDSTNTDSLTT